MVRKMPRTPKLPGRPPTEPQRLRQVLALAKVDELIIEFLLDTLGMASLADFVDYVDHGKYQVELQKFVLDVLPKVGKETNPLSKSRINLYRLRTAWRTAQELVQREARKGTPQPALEALVDIAPTTWIMRSVLQKQARDLRRRQFLK